MNISQKIKLHNRLYAYADKLIKKHNPCKIENGRCTRNTFCCGSCKYLAKNGCSINCLGCKLWLCDCLHQKPEYRSLILKLKRIERVALRNNILTIRSSKEDLARHLCNIKYDQPW